MLAEKFPVPVPSDGAGGIEGMSQVPSVVYNTGNYH